MEREDHDEESKNADLIKQPKAELKPGDVTWIKLRGASWWPAQVHFCRFFHFSFLQELCKENYVRLNGYTA